MSKWYLVIPYFLNYSDVVRMVQLPDIVDSWYVIVPLQKEKIAPFWHWRGQPWEIFIAEMPHPSLLSMALASPIVVVLISVSIFISVWVWVWVCICVFVSILNTAGLIPCTLSKEYMDISSKRIAKKHTMCCTMARRIRRAGLIGTLLSQKYIHISGKENI